MTLLFCESSHASVSALCSDFSYAAIRLYSKEECQVPKERRKQLKHTVRLLRVAAKVELLLPHVKFLVSTLKMLWVCLKQGKQDSGVLFGLLQSLLYDLTVRRSCLTVQTHSSTA